MPVTCALLREKDVPGLAELASRVEGLGADTVRALQALATLNGGPEIIARKKARELPAVPGMAQATAPQALVDAMPGGTPSVDLSPTSADYGYHSGDLPRCMPKIGTTRAGAAPP